MRNGRRIAWEDWLLGSVFEGTVSVQCSEILFEKRILVGRAGEFEALLWQSGFFLHDDAGAHYAH